MLKIIKREFKMNDTSFQPELEVIIRIPLEPVMDYSALVDEDEFAHKLGAELIKQIKAVHHD